MTEKGYLQDIRRKCASLGIWRDEFERTSRRLAKIYVRIDEVEKLFKESGGRYVIEYTNTKGAENSVRNPYIVQIDTLYDQALVCEKELGLTAAALKKINEAALHEKEKSPLAGIFELVNAV